MAAKPRSIFEEVGTAQKADVAQATPGGIDSRNRGARGAVRLWLMLIAALVVLIVVVGGMTRLTDSGLSITEWKPISGMVPPSGEAAWQDEFALYQATPEFQLQNSAMTLAEFKSIFWWEWGHRQLGRVIGLVWALGFLGFLVARKIPTGWTGRLFRIGVLIGVQAAIGWWMVSSGLVGDRTDVLSYRLATHLGIAFIILGTTVWFALSMGRTEADLMQARRAGEGRLFSGATGLMHLAFLQIVLGALVAGIDAGRNFPTWPLMGDGFFPPDPFTLTPLWRNFFEDAGLVQFIHRMVAYALFLFGIVVWLRGRKSANDRTRLAAHLVMGMLALQVVLGIYTALTQAHLHVAITHQLGAVVLWVLILRLRFLSRYPLPQSIKRA